MSGTLPLPLLDHGPGDAQRQAALPVVLEASAIEVPAEPYDPRGRFISTPTSGQHPEKESAMAVVENPDERAGGR